MMLKLYPEADRGLGIVFYVLYPDDDIHMVSQWEIAIAVPFRVGRVIEHQLRAAAPWQIPRRAESQRCPTSGSDRPCR